MNRLFVAIDLPEEIRASLADLDHELPGASWVSPRELHLTLRFIGEVNDNVFLAVKAALSSVRFARFLLRLRGVGHFPPGQHPRVLWVGTDPCEELPPLRQQVERALVEVGIPADERRFSPHMTLARLKKNEPTEVADFESRHHDLACPIFQIGAFALYSSVLSHTGALHRVEAVYPCEPT